MAAETLQQNQTLSLRISKTLRKRLEDIRKLTALRKGKSVSTSEIAKQLLESARGNRFETVELLSKPIEAVLEIRRKGEAGHLLFRVQRKSRAARPRGFFQNPFSGQNRIGIVKKFDAANEIDPILPISTELFGKSADRNKSGMIRSRPTRICFSGRHSKVDFKQPGSITS